MVEEATKYLDKTEIEGFGGNLILYKRPDLDAVTWHYRAKIEGMKGYVRRSTKETNFELAKRKAEQEFIENTGKFNPKHTILKAYLISLMRKCTFCRLQRIKTLWLLQSISRDC